MECEAIRKEWKKKTRRINFKNERLVAGTGEEKKKDRNGQR